jgi:hypothetical protein
LWNQHRKRIFYTHHDDVQSKKCHGFLGLGKNFEVVPGIGFLTNFPDILDFAV